MKVFTAEKLNQLVERSSISPRLRQHQNIHADYGEACQRLFNAIEPGSYIRPHRHKAFPRDELLVAVRGLMVLATFKDDGQLLDMQHFGTEKYGADIAIGVELDPQTWHTVLALVPGSVLLEVKAGPYDPTQPKDYAEWAPEENSPNAHAYMQRLQELLNKK